MAKTHMNQEATNLMQGTMCNQQYCTSLNSQVNTLISRLLARYIGLGNPEMRSNGGKFNLI